MNPGASLQRCGQGHPAGPVPTDLQPPLASARDDIPVIYADGCNADEQQVAVLPCVFGATDSATTVMLFGDSHAAHWFPALERLATERGWRLVTMSKSTCAPIDHVLWSGNLKTLYPQCSTWREAAFERIEREHPALVVVTSSRVHLLDIDGHAVLASERPEVWDAALGRTLARIKAVATHVVLLSDTPMPAVDPPACLSAHLDDTLPCDTPVDVALGGERVAADEAVAQAAGATVIDPTQWVCPSDPCPSIIGSTLIYRDGSHFTATFAWSLAPYLGAALDVVGAAP